MQNLSSMNSSEENSTKKFHFFTILEKKLKKEHMKSRHELKISCLKLIFFRLQLFPKFRVSHFCVFPNELLFCCCRCVCQRIYVSLKKALLVHTYTKTALLFLHDFSVLACQAVQLSFFFILLPQTIRIPCSKQP